MKNYQVIIVAIILGFVTGIFFINKSPSFGGTSFVNSQACTISTDTVAIIGNQLSSTLLAANSRRAWAIIQQPLNATNTVAVSFNNGASATLNSGLQLQNASTTNGVYEIHFGLATEFPYTGVVTGITSTGSTTVRITQCVY